MAPTVDQLAQKHGVEPPEINAATKSIRLSRQAASNAEVFRAAKAHAEAEKLILIVDPIEQAGPVSNGWAGSESE